MESGRRSSCPDRIPIPTDLSRKVDLRERRGRRVAPRRPPATTLPGRARPCPIVSVPSPAAAVHIRPTACVTPTISGSSAARALSLRSVKSNRTASARSRDAAGPVTTSAPAVGRSDPRRRRPAAGAQVPDGDREEAHSVAERCARLEYPRVQAPVQAQARLRHDSGRLRPHPRISGIRVRHMSRTHCD